MRLETKAISATARMRASSLDFTPRRGLTTTTKPLKRKGRNASSSTTPAPPPRTFSTRARGGSGPPPHARLTLADLEGFSEAEIIKALYADPHLAKEAAQTIEPKDSAARPMSGAGKDAASKKGKARVSSRVPNGDIHEQRIPVFQWAILLLLFGAAAYQLRKVFLLPEKHGKRRKSKGAVTTASIARDWTKIPSELLEANMNSAVDLNRKKGIPQAKTKKKRKVTMPMLETTSSCKNSSKLVPSIPSDRQMEPAAALEKANGAVWQTDSEVKRLPVSTGKSETFAELPTLIDQLPPPNWSRPWRMSSTRVSEKRRKSPR